MSEHTGLKNCDQCGNPTRRIYSHCKFHFTGTKIEDAEYNIGLGKVTKSKRHRDDLAKRAGVEEIGNEDPDKIHRHFDLTREKKIKKSWDEV